MFNPAFKRYGQDPHIPLWMNASSSTYNHMFIAARYRRKLKEIMTLMYPHARNKQLKNKSFRTCTMSNDVYCEKKNTWNQSSMHVHRSRMEYIYVPPYSLCISHSQSWNARRLDHPKTSLKDIPNLRYPLPK